MGMSFRPAHHRSFHKTGQLRLHGQLKPRQTSQRRAGSRTRAGNWPGGRWSRGCSQPLAVR